MAHAWVSIGSNIERRKHIARALELLEDHFGEIEQSSVYESAAVGFDSEPFFNMVVGLNTDEMNELFDLKNDPSEEFNLYENAVYKQQLETMKKELRNTFSEIGNN